MPVETSGDQLFKNIFRFSLLVKGGYAVTGSPAVGFLRNRERVKSAEASVAIPQQGRLVSATKQSIRNMHAAINQTTRLRFGPDFAGGVQSATENLNEIQKNRNQ
jgi:hypothetical protein